MQYHLERFNGGESLGNKIFDVSPNIASSSNQLCQRAHMIGFRKVKAETIAVVTNMKSDPNGCVVLSKFHVFFNYPLAVLTERPPTVIGSRKCPFQQKYNHFEKKFSKIDKKFVSQSILEVGHMIISVHLLKTTKFTDNHQNPSNLLKDFLYKKSRF